MSPLDGISLVFGLRADPHEQDASKPPTKTETDEVMGKLYEVPEKKNFKYDPNKLEEGFRDVDAQRALILYRWENTSWKCKFVGSEILTRYFYFISDFSEDLFCQVKSFTKTTKEREFWTFAASTRVRFGRGYQHASLDHRSKYKRCQEYFPIKRKHLEGGSSVSTSNILVAKANTVIQMLSPHPKIALKGLSLISRGDCWIGRLLDSSLGPPNPCEIFDACLRRLVHRLLTPASPCREPTMTWPGEDWWRVEDVTLLLLKRHPSLPPSCTCMRLMQALSTLKNGNLPFPTCTTHTHKMLF